jgi:phospholipid transport system substrate-binding protein
VTVIGRRGVICGLVGAVAWPGLAAAQALLTRGREPSAEAFIQEQAQKILTVLANPKLSTPEKQRIFRQLIDEVADVPRISTFVLGRYARLLTPPQRQRFDAAFRTYAEGVYRDRLGDYHGEVLKITGSVARRPGDVVVNSLVSGGKVAQPLPVSWRVLGSDGLWKVVATLDSHGGDIQVLIHQLETAHAATGRKPAAHR